MVNEGDCEYAIKNEWGPEIDCDNSKNEMNICDERFCPLDKKIKDRLFKLRGKAND